MQQFYLEVTQAGCKPQAAIAKRSPQLASAK
jgi:hypothetical protein